MKSLLRSTYGISLVSISLLFPSNCAKPAEQVRQISKAVRVPFAVASEIITPGGSQQAEIAQIDEPRVAPLDAAGASDAPAQAGIGTALRVEDGKVFVHKVLPETPAARSHAIQPEDQVIAVAEGDGEPVDVTGMKLASVVGMIRGPKGSTVRLTIVPAGKALEDLVVVSLIRGEFQELNTFVDGRLLPIGATAPNIRFTQLVDGRVAELSGFAGRIVLIEFWATWCGPCIRALDELDRLQANHPEWNGKVELIAVSVDEDREDAVKFFRKERWAGITAVWAGPDVLKSYRVSGLPTMFVIGQDGRVAGADHRLDISELVQSLLQGPRP